MRVLVLSGVLKCGHDGRVVNAASQTWVRIAGDPLLVAEDPEGRPIAGCPNISTNSKPCRTTKEVTSGYSGFVRIGGAAVCLDAVQGPTDGVPPSLYTVRSAGQDLVGADR